MKLNLKQKYYMKKVLLWILAILAALLLLALLEWSAVQNAVEDNGDYFNSRPVQSSQH